MAKILESLKPRCFSEAGLDCDYNYAVKFSENPFLKPSRRRMLLLLLLQCGRSRACQDVVSGALFLSGQQDPSGGRGRRGGRGSNIIETVHHQWGREHKKSLGRKTEGGGSLVRQCVTSVQRQWKEIDGWGNKRLSKRLRYMYAAFTCNIAVWARCSCLRAAVSSSRG